MMKTFVYILSALSLVIVGCSQSTDATSTGGDPGVSATLPSITPDKAMSKAENILRKKYRLATVDYVRYRIVTEPVEYTARETTASITYIFAPSKHTFRRFVTIRIRPDSSGSTAYVRVDIQRRDTTSHQAFAQQRQSDHRPSNQTMVSSSTDTDKSEVWTNIRRDPAEENNLLDLLKK
jgi:hypothetical protein